jgi:hypothetical protein
MLDYDEGEKAVFFSFGIGFTLKQIKILKNIKKLNYLKSLIFSSFAVMNECLQDQILNFAKDRGLTDYLYSFYSIQVMYLFMLFTQ